MKTHPVFSTGPGACDIIYPPGLPTAVPPSDSGSILDLGELNRQRFALRKGAPRDVVHELLRYRHDLLLAREYPKNRIGARTFREADRIEPAADPLSWLNLFISSRESLGPPEQHPPIDPSRSGARSWWVSRL